MTSEAKSLAYPPGLGTAPNLQTGGSTKLEQADATTDQDNLIKEPRIFPRRRPDLTDAQAERREALRSNQVQCSDIEKDASTA